jgi:hypothetical protein
VKDRIPSQSAAAAAFSFTVMRLCGLALTISVNVLAGCATGGESHSVEEPPEAFQHCDPKQSDEWRLSTPPTDFTSILAIPSGEGTIDSELGHEGSREQSHEHWFEKDESHVAVCRHKDVPDSCYSNSTIAYVKQLNGQWVADGPVMEAICYVHERRK